MFARRNQPPVMLDVEAILQTLNQPDAAAVLRYSVDQFHQNEDNIQALRALARPVSGPANLAALTALAMVTYQADEIEYEEYEELIEYTKERDLEHINTSIRSVAALTQAIYSSHDGYTSVTSISAPYFTAESYINIGAMSLHSLHARGLHLHHANLGYASLEDSVLVHANLHGSYLVNAYLRGADFSESNLTRCVLTNAHLDNVNFTQTCLTDVKLNFLHTEQAKFQRARITRTDFSRSELHRCDFTEASGQHTTWRNTNVKFCDFPRTDLCHAAMQTAKFSSCDFQSAKLAESNMANSHFVSCDFTLASLDGATLVDSTLTSSRFINTNFGFANCRGADFTDACLQGANITHARFEGAKLDQAIFIESAIVQNDVNTTYRTLTDLHQQIKDHKDRRLLRSAIVQNIIRFAKDMDWGSRKRLFDAIQHHPCFDHKRPSIRKEINATARLFGPNHTDRLAPLLSKTQMTLMRGILPEALEDHSHHRRSNYITM